MKPEHVTHVPSVTLINNHTPPTAIYRYATSIKRCLPGATTLLHAFPHRPPPELEIEGEVELGIHTGSLGVDGILNYLFWGSAFPRTRRKIRDPARLGLTHFASPDLPPIANPQRGVITVHDNPLVSLDTDLYNLPPRVKFIVRRNLRSYEKWAITITQSSYVARGLRSYGYRGRIEIVPPALHPSFRPTLESKLSLRRKLGLPEKKTLILSISTAAQRKNLDLVQKVMGLLPSSFQLVRVGPPLAGSLGFRNATDETLASIYGACDALLFPSLEEGFGVPVIEAFATGLPVVASNIDSISEVSGGAANLLDPKNPVAFAQGIREVVANPTEWVELGLRRGEDFRPERIGVRLAAAYARVDAGST
jgi:glycosyltransferase involved in cell wall biosynthesis